LSNTVSDLKKNLEWIVKNPGSASLETLKTIGLIILFLGELAKQLLFGDGNPQFGELPSQKPDALSALRENNAKMATPTLLRKTA
jgi:hypothetical protein